eukprot:Gb_20513 [translate_table: standard]
MQKEFSSLVRYTGVNHSIVQAVQQQVLHSKHQEQMIDEHLDMLILLKNIVVLPSKPSGWVVDTTLMDHYQVLNLSMSEIAGQLRVGLQSMDILSQFHHVFWIGDLNYRLDFANAEERPLTPQYVMHSLLILLSVRRRFWHKKVKQILDGEYKELLQYDELRKEKAASRVLHGFKEGVIHFPPTFKKQNVCSDAEMLRESTNMYDQKRMPAWCDRVLWRTLQGCEAKLDSYTYSPQILTRVLSSELPIDVLESHIANEKPISEMGIVVVCGCWAIRLWQGRSA